MNERIQKLIEQATSTQGPTPYNPLTFEVFDKEKFAELIVRECFEHCKGQLVDKKTADHMGLTYNDGVMDCATGLLQHFGVEE